MDLDQDIMFIKLYNKPDFIQKSLYIHIQNCCPQRKLPSGLYLMFRQNSLGLLVQQDE